MELSYSEANRIAKMCLHLEGMACRARDSYRDCDRPLCCGFCPIVDDCEGTCNLIITTLLEEEWKR